MKRVSILFIIMLLILSNGYAEGNEADHWEKIRQLNQLAEKFKAETGFEGEVIHSTTTMKLHVYRGNFPDISFSADEDSTAFRQACEAIIYKILPYSRANKNQLSMSRIRKSGRGYTTDYYQRVNGYRVESSGFIVITYEEGRKNFSTGDNTVELPDGDYSVLISKERAEQIALKDKNDERYSVSKVYNLFFSKEGSESYYLAYFVVVSSAIDSNLDKYVYWIDAQTGNVKKSCIAPVYRSDLVVSVGGNYYGPTVDWDFINTQSDSLAIPESRVRIDSKWTQSNAMGLATLSNVKFRDQKVRLANRYFWMTIDNDADTLATNSFIPDQSVVGYYHVMYPDSNNEVAHYAPNSYVEALSQIDYLDSLSPNYFDNQIKISTACPMDNAGSYIPSDGIIRLKDARVHYVVRHELSHHFIHRVLGSMMGSTSQAAMDEGFATYFGGASKNDTLIPQMGGAYDLNDLNHITVNTATNESSYVEYNNGIPLASAWWALRSDSNFGPTAVDTLLVNSLDQVKDEIDFNHAYRYKPRYFYNILMSRVDADKQSWPFNDKQTAINDVYSARGFHFYPKVQSVVSASVSAPLARESFNVLDSVYVHISNCPQNTYVQVFVVEDRDYYEVGADGIDIPAPYEVNGNPVSGIFKTNSDGKWAGSIPFSRLLPQGDYDIIVNVGSPSAPDNKLHLVFAKDNIIDGVDGLVGPGFTKIGTGDIVVALDLSSSMSGYGDQLAQMAKALQQSMLDTERINVFGFTEGTASQGWIEDGITDLIGDENSFLEAGQIDSTYVTNVLNSIQIDGNTDLVLPFHHGASRLNNLGDTGNRKSIILLSDGIHFVTPPHDDFPGYQGNWTHTIGFIDTLITSVVVPDSISCYTICYGYVEEGLNQMLNFAKKGNGAFFLANELSDLKLHINQLLCSIRGTAPVENSIRNIEPGVVQSHKIMVEPGASELRLVVIGKTDPGGGGISYTLLSPSGVSLKSADDAETRRVMNPESGIWTALIVNNSSSSASYNILGDTRSDISLCVSPPPVSHPMDRPLIISASLKDYHTPITNSSVTARLSWDNWQIEVPLYDDGCHQDGNAADGVYANYLYPYTLGYDVIPAPGAVCELEIIADMPSVGARRKHVQQIYIENNNTYSYPVTHRLLTRGWNWVGFPRLPDYEGGNTIPAASITLMPYLEQIVSADGTATYDDFGWHYDGLSLLNSVSGYKLLVNAADQTRIYYSGATTDTTLAYPLQKDTWNWLTYPCFRSAYPEDALATVIDHVDYIMAQNWSMKKMNGVWIKDEYSHHPVLRYGDTILIRSNENIDLFWSQSNELPPEVEALESNHFSCQNKPNYETLMVESVLLSNDKTLKEIGVFQNQECIGARIVEGFPLQLLVYSESIGTGALPLEIRGLTCDDTEITLRPIAIWDEEGTEASTFINPSTYGFRYMSLKENDQIPTVLAMSNNYPNPFNPSTTIGYAIPQAGHVKLDIHNIRGQKVKSLVDDHLSPGFYNAVWDGKDHGDRNVSSGVYFARLVHGKKTKVQKMVLVK